jgi:hypothetical protein
MSKARELAELGAVYDSGALANRNIIINGDMRVAQRGTSFSGTTGVVQLVDRWHTPIGTSFNLDTTITQSTTVPTGEGFKYSLKVEADSVVTPSGGENGGIGTKFEGQDIEHFAYGSSSAKSVTLSFWVRSNKTGVYCCQLQVNQYGGSNQYGQVKEYTISAANTWEKKTLTFSGLTAQAVETVTGDGLRVLWWLACGSSDHVAADTWIQSASYAATSNQVNFMDSASNEWYLTGCQLEVGTEATPFEHRSFADELLNCQRYTYVITGDDDDMTGIMGYGESASNARFPLLYPVNMRTSPSFTLSGTCRAQGGTADSANFTSGLAIVNANTNHTGSALRVTGTSNLASDRGYNLQVKADGTTLTFDAEL